jgi:hypothetical protein
MTSNKKSTKQLKNPVKDPKLEAKRERKQKRITLAGAKNNKENKDFIIETNDLATIRPIEKKLKFSDLELTIITYVKQLVTKYKSNEFTKVTFRIKDFMDTIGSTTHNYKHIREACDKIRDTGITMRDKDQNNLRVYTSYFSSVITDDDPSEITVTIDPEVLNHLGKQSNKFVTYRANLIYKLKGSYAKIMYPYLKSILGKSQKKNTTTRMTLDELKELLSISDKYKSFKHLNHRVLKEFVEEINTKTDIFIDYIPEKKGRTTHKLLFEIRKQKQKAQNITEAINNNPATEELKEQGFSDLQTSEMLGINDFIPDDDYMAILSNYIYLDEDDLLLINENIKRDKISIEAFKQICVLANKYYKFKVQKGEVGKFLSTNIFNKAIKERWDKSNPIEKEINPQPVLELTLEQKVKEVASNETLYNDFIDHLFDLGTDKAKELMKSITKQGILNAYTLEPHYFNLLQRFWDKRGK